jgi:hypothetical protein
MGLHPKCGERDGGDMSHSEIFFFEDLENLVFQEKF